MLLPLLSFQFLKCHYSELLMAQYISRPHCNWGDRYSVKKIRKMLQVWTCGM